MSGETSGTVLVKARKTHRCVACEHPIRTGTVHARWAWFEDGTAQTVRAHQMCSDLDLGLDDDNMYCFDGEIALDDFLTRFTEWRDSDIEWAFCWKPTIFSMVGLGGGSLGGGGRERASSRYRQ